MEAQHLASCLYAAAKAVEHTAAVESVAPRGETLQQVVARIAAVNHQRQLVGGCPLYLGAEGGLLLLLMAFVPVVVEAYLTNGNKLRSVALAVCREHLPQPLQGLGIVVCYLLGVQSNHGMAEVWVAAAEFHGLECGGFIGGRQQHLLCSCFLGTGHYLVNVVPVVVFVDMGVGVNKHCLSIAAIDERKGKLLQRLFSFYGQVDAAEGVLSFGKVMVYLFYRKLFDV